MAQYYPLMIYMMRDHLVTGNKVVIIIIMIKFCCHLFVDFDHSISPAIIIFELFYTIRLSFPRALPRIFLETNFVSFVLRNKICFPTTFWVGNDTRNKKRDACFKCCSNHSNKQRNNNVTAQFDQLNIVNTGIFLPAWAVFQCVCCLLVKYERRR